MISNELDDRAFAFQFNQAMIKHGLTLACAESMTAGLLASTLAAAPGTMAVLHGSIVVYTPAFKEDLLGVPRHVVETFSAESRETTYAMLGGLQALFPKASIHVAVTGVATAPPGAPDPSKVPGQLYVAIGSEGRQYAFETILRPPAPDEWGNEIRRAAVRYILERVLERIDSQF